MKFSTDILRIYLDIFSRNFYWNFFGKNHLEIHLRAISETSTGILQKFLQILFQKFLIVLFLKFFREFHQKYLQRLFKNFRDFTRNISKVFFQSSSLVYFQLSSKLFQVIQQVFFLNIPAWARAEISTEIISRNYSCDLVYNISWDFFKDSCRSYQKFLVQNVLEEFLKVSLMEFPKESLQKKSVLDTLEVAQQK